MRFSFTLSVLLIAAAVQGLAAPSAGWSVTYQPARIVNGSPVVFRVRAPKSVRSLSGRWLDHDFSFSFNAQERIWFALAGASFETKHGSYSLQLQAENAAGATLSFEKRIPVAEQHYPRVVLTVPPKYTAPSVEEQQQIAEAKKIKDEAFKTLTPEREWQGSFFEPVEAEISDIFGVQRVFNGTVESTHQGLDFRVPSGTTVDAVNRGKVILAQPLYFEGNLVVIDHGQGLLTLYMHLSKFLVKEGDVVEKGQPIALSGGTGRATGPHLHLAVRWQGIYLDPKILLGLKLP